MPRHHTHKLRRRVATAAIAAAMLAPLGFAPAAQSVAAPQANTMPGIGALIYIANQGAGRIDVHDATLHGPVPRMGILDTTFNNGPHYAIEVGDLNGDLRDEVLVANSGTGDEAGRIDVLDAITSRPVPGLGVLDTTYENTDNNEIEVGDVNGDGRDEILIANAGDGDEAGRIDVLDGNGNNVPGHGIFDTTFEDHPANQIAVGDVTGDGRDDVIISNHTHGGRIDVLDTATNAPILGFGIHDTTLNRGDHYQIAVGDVDGDGRDEILVANSGTGDEAGRIDVFDAATGHNIPEYGIGDTTYENSEHNEFDMGDVNGDGRDDVVIANAADHAGEHGSIYILDAMNGVAMDGLFVTDTTFEDDAHNQLAVGRFGDGDFDEDGLPDAIEVDGIRNADGSMNFDLKSRGASPCRKTLLVEIDYMDDGLGHHHRPDPASITMAENAFGGAPVPAITDCPYPGADSGEGVQLIVDTAMGTVAHQDVLSMPSGFADIKAANFDRVRDPFVHYNLWGHRYDAGQGDGSSGLANFAADQQDFLVTLGIIGGGNGGPPEQAGTFMHELGHTIGLHHGGGDGINFKPNYLSSMNYQFQFTGLTDSTTNVALPNYSEVELPELDAMLLDESAGLGPTAPNLDTTWRDPNLVTRTEAATGSKDWNWDFTISPTTQRVPVAINGGFCVSAGANGTLDTTAHPDDDTVAGRIVVGGDFDCDTARTGDDVQDVGVGVSQRHLKGFNDWAHINLRRGLRPGEGVIITEATRADIDQAQQAADQAAAPDTTFRLMPPRAGFTEPVHGLAMDDRYIYATHHYVTQSPPFTSDPQGTLVVLDRVTLAIKAKIRVGYKPHDVAVNPVTGRIYVLNTPTPQSPNTSDVTVLDRATLSVLSTVNLVTAQSLFDVAVNSRTNRVYLSNFSQGFIHVLDGATNAELPKVQLGKGVLGMAVDESRNTIHVAMSYRVFEPFIAALGSFTDDGTTTVILPQVPLGDPLVQPQDVAVDPIQNRIYTANLGGGGVEQPSVSVVDGATRTVLARINTPKPQRAIAVNPYAHQVFSVGELGVTVISTDGLSVMRTISTGLTFSVVTGTGPGRQLFTGAFNNGELSRRSYSSGTPQ